MTEESKVNYTTQYIDVDTKDHWFRQPDHKIGKVTWEQMIQFLQDTIKHLIN